MSGECDKCGEHALECSCNLDWFAQNPHNLYECQWCECGRLYKDRRDENGKMMCSACYTGLSIEDLKKLWGTPIPDYIKPVKPDTSNEFRFYGTLEEFKKYLPELYEQIRKSDE